MAQPPEEWTVLSMLKWATSYFEEKQVQQPRLSIEWLLAHVLDVKRLDLYLMYDRPLAEAHLQDLRPLVKRRAQHEPLQYIVGQTDFMGIPIHVKPGVLIPRPETEQLVELVLDHNEGSAPLKVLDIGTGSGCIPIALKKLRPLWDVSAVDISTEALEIARQNASLSRLEVNFLEGDLFQPEQWLPELKFECILSNPPYILPEEKSTLNKEVVDFEPDLALFCTSTQQMYGALRELSEKALAQNGFLFMELNERFGDQVLELFTSSSWEAKLVQDYDGKDRFLVAKKI